MERGSGYPARCRSPWGAQVPRAAVGRAPARPAWSGVSGGARTLQRGGWLGSARLGRAGMGWAVSAFPHRSPGGQGATARSLPRPIVAPRGGVSRQPAPSPPVPVLVPTAPAVSTGTASAAEPPRLPAAPAFLARHSGLGRREQTSPLPQPGRWRRRRRGS